MVWSSPASGQRLELDRDDAHVEVEATWGIYQRMFAAYRHEDRRRGRELMTKLIADLNASVPTAQTDLITQGRTLKTRAAVVLSYFDRPADTIEMMAVTGDGAWIVQTPLLPLKANGSGDVTAALFTAHLHETGSPGEALGRTVSSVFDLLENTHRSGERELQLVQSQESFAHPKMGFKVTQVR